jgi:hypothetical protein
MAESKKSKKEMRLYKKLKKIISKIENARGEDGHLLSIPFEKLPSKRDYAIYYTVIKVYHP